MAEEKTESKSGIVGPAGYNGGSGPSGDALQAPTKVYEGSRNLGKGASKDGGFIVGPASGKNTDKAGK